MLGWTGSADSTSHRKINYDSRHMALATPMYSSGDLDVPNGAIPSMRFLGITQSVDHAAETSKDGWVSTLDDIEGVYNKSPLAVRRGVKLTTRHVAKLLKGMNADHASAEKSAANLVHEWKTEVAITGLGEDRLEQFTATDLVLYLMKWKQDMVDDAGGFETWMGLSETERSRQELALIGKIKVDLGKEAYEQLPTNERRELDLFLWAGCCMHKDQNTFKAGNTAMMACYTKLELSPPLLLANKQNASILRGILDPAAPPGPMTEDELTAFEASTRGGVKAVALAGTIFNNKDDKKGQGDAHVFHFMEIDGNSKHFQRFPDTSNTRFNSHAEAAAELLTHLDKYLEFMLLIRDKKKSPAWTNIELNVYCSLQDIPTLTELAVMTLYSQAVTHPYMRVVRGPGTSHVNVLDLKDFHVTVREFIQGVVDEPGNLFGADATPKLGSLDGKDWHHPRAVKAVQAMLPRLPDITTIAVVFLKGTLPTWERFTSEFAPGGLIDTATADELALSWMPSTNDANEGGLGTYRNDMRLFPRLTLHQHNARQMWARNDTQEFMDATLDALDHTFLMREARKLDSSGLEAKRRKAQVDFDLRVAELKREKDAEKKRQQIASLRAVFDVEVVLSESEIDKMTVKQLDEQLDLYQKYALDEVLVKMTKKARGLKVEKQRLTKEALKRYLKHLSNGGDTIYKVAEKQLITLELAERPENHVPEDGWEEEEIAMEVD